MINSQNTNLNESLSNKKVIVTGGTGLIGRQIIDILTKINCNVTSVSLDNLKLNKDCNYIYGDLTDFGFCQKITKGFDFAIHTAGIKGSVDVTNKKPASFFTPMLMMNTNFSGFIIPPRTSIIPGMKISHGLLIMTMPMDLEQAPTLS